MDAVIQQALLALGAGAAVAIAGQGIVQIYRGSGVLNFAHGAMALASAQLFVWAWDDKGLPLVPAMFLAVALGAGLGLLTHVLVMRPLRLGSQLVRIIATIGVMQIVQQGSQLIFGGENRFVDSFLPVGPIQIGDFVIPKAALVTTAVALALTVLLSATMKFSRFGTATRAVADNEVVARSLGLSPDLIAAMSWTLGGALAGLAGVMLVPGGLSIVSVLLVTVPAFAAAVLGGFRSYLTTTVGAIAIAMAQSVFTFQSVRDGWPAGIAPATPFIVVALVLLVRSDALPTRDEAIAKLPRAATSPPRWLAVLVSTVGVTLALTADADLANALITSFAAAIVGLSLVVVTGLSGQISLAQYALAGLGALAAARTSELLGWPFLICVAVGVAAAAMGGAVLALPALRTRGPALAVVTIGLGLAVQQGILADIDITGGVSGATAVERPTLFGLDVNAVEHPNRYAAVVIGTFAALAVMVANVRRNGVGRHLLAVRNNERAAAALGVSVPKVKLYAFVLAAAIAGAGGVLIAFRFDAVQYGQFTFFKSLEVLSFTLIGGIGFVTGPLFGAAAVPNGLLATLANNLGDLERWLLLGSGAILIATLIKAPDGLAALLRDTTGRPKQDSEQESEIAPSLSAAVPRELVVEGLGVRYGNVTALDGIDITVSPGQIVGLIGANGAGKTTLIDAISGFTSSQGSIRIDGVELTQKSATDRARLGIGRCFQTIELFEDLSVRDNMLVATDDVRGHRWLSDLVLARRGVLDGHSHAVVEQLGLVEHLDSSPGSLSHGQRRLVGVARALVAKPGVLLLDEPAAGLDREETASLGESIRGLADAGIGMLLVEHDIDLVLSVSDHVVAIDFGEVIYDGDPAGVADDPRIRRAYLGTEESDVEEPDVTEVPQ